MYEISLVPDIKAQLLKKQKLRNLIIFICIIVAIACGGVLLILSTIAGGQSIQIGLQKNEIDCRIDGTGTNCSRYNDKGDPEIETNFVKGCYWLGSKYKGKIFWAGIKLECNHINGY